MTEKQKYEFDAMVELVLIYINQGRSDSALPEIFKTVREKHPSAYQKLQLLVAAISDPRFTGCTADAGLLLRKFETTTSLKADLERFIELLLEEDYLNEFQARLTVGDHFAVATKNYADQHDQSATA